MVLHHITLSCYASVEDHLNILNMLKTCGLRDMKYTLCIMAIDAEKIRVRSTTGGNKLYEIPIQTDVKQHTHVASYFACAT